MTPDRISKSVCVAGCESPCRDSRGSEAGEQLAWESPLSSPQWEGLACRLPTGLQGVLSQGQSLRGREQTEVGWE